MTAPRIARAAGRSRFFILLGILILMIGFITIFQSSQQHQLDELRQISIRCEQQQEAISSEMQNILEQKLRLESSVASQKQMYDETKHELEQKAKDEKELRSKSLSEANSHLASLQQHHKLTMSQLEDLTEECSSSKQKQLEEINGLQGKVSSLQSQVKQMAHEKEKEIENWKIKYNQLESEKHKLEKIINDQDNDEQTNAKLKLENLKIAKELVKYKKKYPFIVDDDLVEGGDGVVVEQKKLDPIDRNFHEQKAIVPRIVDNNNNQNNVLLQPFDIKTSTPSSSPSNNNNNNIIHDNNDIPLIAPDLNKQTSSTAIKNIVSTKKVKSKSLPSGVVPIPENMKEFINNKNNNDNLSDDNNVINRYSNVLNSINNNAGDKHSENDINNKNLEFPNIVDEQDNGAHEEHDNEFDIDDKNKKYANNIEHQNKLNMDLDKLNNNNIKNNNNAEEDTNLYEINPNNKNLFLQNSNNNNNINNHKDNDNDIDAGVNGGGINKFDDKLRNEIAGDHGKEGVNYEDDLHMDPDHMQNEEEDVDDYDDPKALNQGHAVRN